MPIAHPLTLPDAIATALGQRVQNLAQAVGVHAFSYRRAEQ